jgi:hypothetical protein
MANVAFQGFQPELIVCRKTLGANRPARDGHLAPRQRWLVDNLPE